MIWLLAALSALAGEHDAAPPPTVDLGDGAVIPEGPPRSVTPAPGADLQALISELPAGSQVRLQPGFWRGPLVIDRPLELSGEPGAVIDGGGHGTVLVVAAPDVVLHDLRVTGGGFLPQSNDSGVVIAADRAWVHHLTIDHAYLGIDLRQADHARIEHNTISGDPTSVFGLRGDGIRLWESDHNVVEGNTLTHTRDLVVWYSNDNEIRGNTVRDSRYGTHLMHTERVRIEGNLYDGDVVGVFVMYADETTLRDNVVSGALGEAGVGLGFKESDRLEVIGNRLIGNTTGIYLDTTPHRNGGFARFADNLVGANEVGARFHGRSDGATFLGNRFVANRTVATVDARVSTAKISFDGNRWSDYAGYDLDRDGRGDLPFEARSVQGSLVARKPALAWFTGTPASWLLEAFAAAFPMFAPPPLLVDPRPALEAR